MVEKSGECVSKIVLHCDFHHDIERDSERNLEFCQTKHIQY